MAKKAAESGKEKWRPDVLEYLAAVNLWKEINERGSTAAEDCCCVTENLHSLLKDIVNTKDAKFFSTFAESYRAAATNSTCAVTTLAPLESSQKKSLSSAQRNLLDRISKEKVLAELNNLYEDYTFATAKDASITDDIRREREPQYSNCMRGDVQLPFRHHSEDSLVYGEIDLQGFCNLLESLSPGVILSSPSSSQLLHGKEILKRGNGIFYDIGSGSGRAVFAARFMGDFDQCTGIELLSNLHQLAISVQSLYKFLYKHKLQWQNVTFHCSDLLDYDWSDGTVVYAPSLLFDDAMMESIARKAILLRPCAYLISLKKFKQGTPASSTSLCFHDAFTMAQQSVVPMSWGDADVYVYRRNEME